MREIYLVRHGETESNVAARWEGFGDSSLTRRGRWQVDRLARRLGGERFDVVTGSDLDRAVATAGAVVPDRYHPDPAWREADLGRWEGLSPEQVMASDADTLAALAAGEDVAMGGGESPAALAGRVAKAFDALADGLDDGGRALVVSHGGAITALVSSILGLDGDHFGVIGAMVNTSVTRIRAGDRGVRIDVFNDAAHIGEDHLGYGQPGTHVLLVRHGETEANRSGVWQGRTDGSMTDEGNRQAGLVAGALPPLTGIYASSLSRARLTAAAIGRIQGIEPVVRDDLVEIAMGAWEGLTPEEIQQRHPDEWRTLIEEHADLPRGGDGETFAAVADRMAGAVATIAAEHDDGPVAIVSHGGAIRAYVSGLVGIGFAGRRRLASPHNTAVSRIVLGGRRPRLASYNVSAHLD
jgi:broad specificity phosphatase PhoE